MRFFLHRIDRSPNWYVAWSEGGRSRLVSTRTPDREEAERFLAAFRLEYDAPEETRPEDLPVAAVLNDYLEHHASKLASAEQARIAVTHLTGFFGNAAVSAITPHAHERYVEHRAGVSNDTINRERMVLRAALNRAVRLGWLRHAPHVPTLPPNPPRERFMSRAEAARLLWAARRQPHLALFIRLGLYTGARPGAVLDLTWDRVDFDAGLIHYPLPQRQGGRKRRAVVPFFGALDRALRAARKRATTDRVIEWRGQGVARIKRAFRAAVAAAGLAGVVGYTLRHTAASWAIKAVPAFEVAKMLGNRVAMVERHYAKLAPDYLRGAVIATTRGARKDAKVPPIATPPPGARPPESLEISRDRMVGAAGIEPATPTMSRKDKPATDLIGAGFSFSANAKDAPETPRMSSPHAKVSHRLAPGLIVVGRPANDGPPEAPPPVPAARMLRRK